MLNFRTPDALFNNCLYECGLTQSPESLAKLDELLTDATVRAQYVRRLEDIRDGSEAIYKKGKPSDKKLAYEEWSRQWQAWSSARKTSFYSRAALLMLGDNSQINFFVDTLAKSHNAVFSVVSRDLLQYVASQFSDESLDELSPSEIRAWWEKSALIK